MPMKRTLRRELADARCDYARAIAERDTAREDRDTERANRRIIGAQLAAEQAAVTRLTGLVKSMKTRLEDALDGRTDGEYTRLTRRLERMTLAYTALRETVGTDCVPPGGWRAERSELVRRLELAERQARSLNAQCAELQAANDAMCRDAATAAGSLVAPVVAEREPGLEVAS